MWSIKQLVVVFFAVCAVDQHIDASEIGGAGSCSAAELVSDVYRSCLQHYSFSCIKPKALEWISNVYDDGVIRITDDLAIRKTGEVSVLEKEQRKIDGDYQFPMLDTIEDFLATHTLDIKVPAALRPGGVFGKFVPRSLTPEDISIPLSEEGRHRKKKSGLFKKVILPFILGLKFKTSVLVPLGLALIALKTWKALTLALLSLVLSGALVIFKFTKPKIVNYEVIHYPHHVDHHVDHIDHPAPAGWEHPGYGRSAEPQEMAYRAYLS